MATKRRKTLTKPGKDEMNLAEFPLSVVGKRSPGKAKTLHFEDEVWDRSKHAFVPRRLTITASDLLGLPNSLDDEVLLGCVQLAKEDNFSDRKLRFSRYQLLELIRWKRDGKSYRRLNESLKRWAGTLVISDKAYWNKRKQCWVEDSFNIIDRTLLAESEEHSLGTHSSLIWGDFMWQSFQAGNLKKLDFDFWLKLRSPVAKRLFRLLDKRFHFDEKIVKFDLKRLAFDKVGLSRNMHTGQIKEKLQPAHQELAELGKYQAEYQRKSRGKWQVEYQRIAATSADTVETAVAKPDEHVLIAALEARGVRNAARLIDKYPAARIREAIENFDDRKAHGQNIGQGWLATAIIQGDYGFRTGFRPRSEIKQERAEQKREEVEEKQKSVVAKKEWRKSKAEFLKLWNSYPVDERSSLEADAMEKARRNGDKFLVSLVPNDKSINEFRRELWRRYVIPMTKTE